jgi:acetyl esterase
MIYASGISEFIERCNAAMPPNFYQLPLDEQRRLYFGLTKVFPYEMPITVSVEDKVIIHAEESLPFRLYVPSKRQGDGLLIYIRGGGFVVGSLETHNTVVAELCARSGLTTVAPDFRMAPEFPFPTALEDCYHILLGVLKGAEQFNINPKKVVICGDSSGANMAVCLAMMCRDRNGPSLAGQALISPVLDFTRWRQGGEDAPLLTGGEMEYYTACYVPTFEQINHAYVSPLIAGRFNDLPPAYIMGASLDPLLVDSQAYASHLQSCGIPVELVVEPGLVHSAVRARGLSPQVADAWDRFCKKAAELTKMSEVTYGSV